MRCAKARQNQFCGYCYAGIRGRSAWKGHAGGHAAPVKTTQEDYMQFISRMTKAPGGKLVAGPSDDTLAQLAPALLEWMTAVAWDDGKARQTGTVMVMTEGGVWKAWMHDRDAKVSSWVTGKDLVEVLTRMDLLLQNGQGEWRSDKMK